MGRRPQDQKENRAGQVEKDPCPAGRGLQGPAVLLLHAVEQPPRVCQRTRNQDYRRHPNLCRRRQRGCLDQSQALQDRCAGKPDGTGRLPAGCIHRPRPALGQPRLQLARAQGRRLRLVAQAHGNDPQAGRHRQDRPLQRLRILLGSPRRSRECSQRQVGSRTRHGSAQALQGPERNRRGSRLPHTRSCSHEEEERLPRHEDRTVRMGLFQGLLRFGERIPAAQL